MKRIKLKKPITLILGVRYKYKELKYDTDDVTEIYYPDFNESLEDILSRAKTIANYILTYKDKKIVIVTESDIIVKEFSTFIALNSCTEEFRKEFAKDYPTLEPSDVDCLTYKNGKIIENVVDKHGITIPYIDDVLDKISFLHNKIVYGGSGLEE